MAQLGNTLAKIAEEKAGIFKTGVPGDHGAAGPGGRGGPASASPRRSARRSTSTGKTIEFSYRFESSRMLGPHNRICLTTPNSKFEHLAVPLHRRAPGDQLRPGAVDHRPAQDAAASRSTTPRAMEGLAKTSHPRPDGDDQPDAARARRRRPQRRQRRRDDAGDRPAHPVRLDGRDLRLLRRQGRRRACSSASPAAPTR